MAALRKHAHRNGLMERAVGGAERPNGTKAVPYCLGEFHDAEMTHDHVIARSWHPAKTPPIAKWEVRACKACNNKKSALVEICSVGWCYVLTQPIRPQQTSLKGLAGRWTSIREGRIGFAAPLQQMRGHAPLCDKSARIVVSMGMPAIVYRWYFRAHSPKSPERNVPGFCGIGPIRETLIGMVDAKSDAKRLGDLRNMHELGRRAW